MSYASEVAADSPLAYYALGESSGTSMVDASGNGRDGTIDAGVVLGGAKIAPGLTGTSWILDAFEGGQTTAASWMAPSALTAEAWIYLTSLTGDPIIMARGFVAGTNSRTNKAWSIQINSSGAILGRLYSATGATAVPTSATGVIAVNTLYHVAVVQDATSASFYVNGVQVATAALSGGPATFAQNTQPLTVGRQSAASNYPYNGRIQHAAFYGTALSAARLLAHYQAGTAAGTPEVTAAPSSAGVLTSTVVAVALAAGALTSAGTATADVTPVYSVDAAASSSSVAAADVEVVTETITVAADSTSIGTVTAAVVPVVAVAGTSTSAGAAYAVSEEVGHTYPDEVLADDPWGYWRLNDVDTSTGPSGVYVPMFDSSGNEHHGIVANHNIGTEFSIPGALPGDIDTAFRWNAFAQGRARVDTDGTNWGQPPFTIEGFFKGGAPGSAQPIVGYGGSVGYSFSSENNEPWVVTYDPGPGLGAGAGVLRFNVRTLTGVVSVTAPVPDPDDWHHFAASWDGAQMRLYLDGVIANADPQTGVVSAEDPDDLERNLSFGTGYGTGTNPNRWSGALDEIALYPSALSDARIAAHWAARDAVVPAVRTGTATSRGSATSTIVVIPGVLAAPSSAGLATAVAVPIYLSTPAVPAAPNAGRTRIGQGVATWEPPVVAPPATVAPVHARIAAHAYTSVTMNGPRPAFTDFVTVDRARHRDRIVVAGRDITYYRGVRTPLPRFGLVSPLLYDAGTLELPQVAACFETPGDGALTWLREGAPVLVQRVAVDGPDAGKVVATDYRGIILGFGESGRSLTVDLGGDATGRAALRDKQPPLFRRRQDLGWWWWATLAGPDSLRRPFGTVGGPTTGIRLYDTGGTTYAQYLNELAAKGTNLAGTQWTCDPIETGPNAGTYRVHRKDTTTITATVYLDDAHTVAQLQAHASERPNRIYGTGVTPRGERAKFGVYPVLAAKQRARFPNYLDPRPIEQGDTNADTDTGGGVTALLHRLSVTGYLSTDAFAGGYDADVAAAVRDLQEDAGLPETGKVNQVTWDALFDVDVTGYSTRGARIEPIAQAASVRRVRRNASGQVVGTNPAYNPQRLPVDRTIDFGTGVTRGQMRTWARTDLASDTPGSNPSGNGRHWTGTIRFELGGLIHGEHTPGDPVTPSMLMHARALRPGDNLWLPHHDGGTLLHVSGVDVNTERQVVATVDTRARDTMTVWEVIARNQDNKRHPARAWIRDHRSSATVKDAVTEFDEIGGSITDQPLTPGWNVFPVVAGQEGTIARLRLRMDRPAEYVTAVFGRRITPGRLAGTIGDPLAHAGAQRWSDPDRLDKLVGDHVLLYVAGDDQAPCGYYPGTKETRTYTPQVPNPTYNVDVAPDNPAYDNRETLPQQIPNPAYDPADPDNDQEFIDNVLTDVTSPATGRWVDDAGFGYRTFTSRGGAVAEGGCVLWVAIYLRHARTLQGGRIMWPQLESGA